MVVRDFNLTCLQVHNDYMHIGGETKTAHEIGNLFEENGIRVIRYYKDNKSFSNKSLIERIIVGFRSIYNKKTEDEIEELLRTNRIDFALVHNVLPLISNSIYNVLLKNNYNLLCLNGAMNKGCACNKCVRNPWQGVMRSCYKNRMLYTFVRLIIKKRFDKKYLSRITGYLTNSEYVKNIHEKYGIDKAKIRVMYNFTNNSNCAVTNNYKSYYLYYGRLTKEKGVMTCVEAFKGIKYCRLVIMGKGELENEITDSIKGYNNIEYIGEKKDDELNNYICHAKCVIVPSEWDEPLPRTILEAFSFGIPVIGAKIGGITEMIRPNLGFLYEAGNKEQLVNAVYLMNNLNQSDYHTMRVECATECKTNYSKQRYIERILEELNKTGIIQRQGLW